MKLSRKRFSALFYSLLFLANAATADRVDSILSLIKTDTGDSLQASLYNSAAWELKYTDQERALKYAEQSLKISAHGKIVSVMGNARNTIGVLEYIRGNYSEATISLREALRMRLQISDLSGAGKTYNNLGLISMAQSDFTSAISYFMSSLRIAETDKNSASEASLLNNIGQVYYKQQNYSKALDYFTRSLKMHEELGDIQSQATNMNNIGSVYFEKEDFNEALRFYRLALYRRIAENNKAEEYNSLQNIGNVYNNLNQYDSSLFYLEKALAGKNSIEDVQKVPTILLNLGYIYSKKGNKEKALSYMLQCLQEAEDQESLDEMKEAYLGLSEIYDSLGKFQTALDYFIKYTDIKDSIYDSSTMDKIASMQSLYETEKRDKEIALLNKDKEIQRAKSHTETIIRNSLITGLCIVLISLITIFFQKKKINYERKRSDELLLNILPPSTALELKQTGKARAKLHTDVSVLFTDFHNFTIMGEELSPEQLVDEINYCYTAFDEIVFKYRLEKIKTIGDSYMCAGGLSEHDHNSAVDSVKVAICIRDFIDELNSERQMQGKPLFGIRIGIHTGPVVAGVVGTRKFAYDIWGDTVNIASRMESGSEVGKINISGNTFSLVKNNFKCTYRGKIEAKNKGMIEMYFVEASNDSSIFAS